MMRPCGRNSGHYRKKRREEKRKELPPEVFWQLYATNNGIPLKKSCFLTLNCRLTQEAEEHSATSSKVMSATDRRMSDLSNWTKMLQINLTSLSIFKTEEFNELFRSAMFWTRCCTLKLLAGPAACFLVPGCPGALPFARWKNGASDHLFLSSDEP